jgi:hypothetical protein
VNYIPVGATKSSFVCLSFNIVDLKSFHSEKAFDFVPTMMQCKTASWKCVRTLRYDTQSTSVSSQEERFEGKCLIWIKVLTVRMSMISNDL